MHIERIELHAITLPLVTPFETSFSRDLTTSRVLVSVHTDGLTGWGECTAGEYPWYSYETVETAWHLLRDVLVPAVLHQANHTPLTLDFVLSRMQGVRGHPMARAALEHAVWDMLAQAQGISLANMLGGTAMRWRLASVSALSQILRPCWHALKPM